MVDLRDLVEALRDAYATWGYPIVFLGAMLENTALLGLLLPGGTLVMLGAVYAQQGTMALPAVLLLAWLGMVAGTSLDYAVGRLGLHSAVSGTRLGERLSPHLARAEQYLERHGAWAFLLAHFIGHVRSFLAITAGMSMLPYRRFLLYEGVAALIWNLIFVGAGYALGKNLDLLQRYAGTTGALILLTAALAFVVYRLVQRRRLDKETISVTNGGR